MYALNNVQYSSHVSNEALDLNDTLFLYPPLFEDIKMNMDTLLIQPLLVPIRVYLGKVFAQFGNSNGEYELFYIGDDESGLKFNLESVSTYLSPFKVELIPSEQSMRANERRRFDVLVGFKQGDRQRVIL
jgi:hypothetical protein